MAPSLKEVQIFLVNDYTKERAGPRHLDDIRRIYEKAYEFGIDNLTLRNTDDIDEDLAERIISIARGMPQTTRVISLRKGKESSRVLYDTYSQCNDCYAQIKDRNLERMNVLYNGHPMFCGKNVNEGISKMYRFQDLNSKRLAEYLSDWEFARFFFEKEECKKCSP